MKVTNENGLSAYDTMEVKVLPDPLKGTIKLYEDAMWERVPGPFHDIIQVKVHESDFFVDRFNGNMEVRYWDKDKNNWSELMFSWSTYNSTLFLYYPYPKSDIDFDDYYKMEGVKTKVQVKIL